MELANRLYVFCPGVEQGLEFIIQELPGSIQRMTGTLPPGKFLSSGVKPITWDEKINGDLRSKESIGTQYSEEVLFRDGSFKADTIVIDRDTFLSLLQQLKNPIKHDYNGYLVFDIGRNKNDKVANNTLKDNKFNNKMGKR